ncbi:uncharacterized protein LOC122304534 [Carya illinoinensis]|uniref:uncharacterized protein LOC122304534 n=1 Tax=Carya illinoinensis TaxID=32201 RepID=UPI001C71D13A|nr:uncharacterized protein LOC122304534 [Carya illinoinensis]
MGTNKERISMTISPTLAMPNFNDSFTIETDAWGDRIGAILTQRGKPIAYMSRALGVTKQSWSTYTKEMLAIVEAIRRENSAADALSSKPNSPVLHHLHVAVVTLWDEIKDAYKRDTYIQSVEHVAKAQPDGPYSQRQGLWLFKGMVVIPSCEVLRTKIL